MLALKILQKLSNPTGLGLVALAASLMLVASCNRGVGTDGGLVGGACSVTSDCEERCLQGGDYPDGTCVTSCTTDEDCPGGSNCIKKEGGVCLLSCDVPSDCRSGYTCKGETNNGHGGDSLVCFKK